MNKELPTSEQRRGLAAVSSGKQRKTVASGDKAAQQKGAADERTPGKAKEGGRKGGTSKKTIRLDRNENDGSDHFL